VRVQAIAAMANHERGHRELPTTLRGRHDRAHQDAVQDGGTLGARSRASCAASRGRTAITLRGIYAHANGGVTTILRIDADNPSVGTLLLEDDQSISARIDGDSRVVDLVFGNTSVVYRATLGPLAP